MKFIKHYEGMGRPSRDSLLINDWHSVDKKTYDHISDFFIELVDHGFEIVIEQFFDSKEEYRYSIECRKKFNHEIVEEDVFNKDWYNKFIIEYGKIFSDSALRLESHSGGRIFRMWINTNGRERFIYDLLLILDNPIIET